MTELARNLQALLFATPEPLKPADLARICACQEDAIQAGLDELAEALLPTGLRLSQHHGTYHLVTAPEATNVLARLHDQDLKQELSRAALETLAIIAYQGPISRHDIEQIRGISSEQILRNLLQRDLIIQHGKSAEAGRPALYAVTRTFLQTVGLPSLTELPPLPTEEHTA